MDQDLKAESGMMYLRNLKKAWCGWSSSGKAENGMKPIWCNIQRPDFSESCGAIGTFSPYLPWKAIERDRP